MLQCTEERSTLRYELRFSKYDKNNLVCHENKDGCSTFFQNDVIFIQLDE